jgi:peptidoglycan/LPS O-acetylase OafA/YrhL
VLRYIPPPAKFTWVYILGFLVFPVFVGLSWITYSLFERPFFRFRRKYAFRAHGERRPEFLVIPAAADLTPVPQRPDAHAAPR